ncbi:MAG: hypothetical protein WCK90_01705 [archaeon]
MTNGLEHTFDLENDLEPQKCLDLIGALGKHTHFGFEIKQTKVTTRRLKYNPKKDEVNTGTNENRYAVDGTFEVPLDATLKAAGEPSAVYIQFNFRPNVKNGLMRYLEFRGVGEQRDAVRYEAQKEAFKDLVEAYQTARPVYYKTQNAGVRVLHDDGHHLRTGSD